MRVGQIKECWKVKYFNNISTLKVKSFSVKKFKFLDKLDK